MRDRRRYPGHDRSEMRGVHYRDPRAPFTRQAQEVWPELSLGDHNQLRLQRIQIRSNRESQVQGEVENAGLSETNFCQLLSRCCCSRDHDSMARKALL